MNPLNYATLEACQRLQAAGIVLETEAWCNQDENGEYHLISYAYCHRADGLQVLQVIPAPSMAEVWRELPPWTCIQKSDDGSHLCWGVGEKTRESIQTNPTDALIDLLIWVTEQRKEKENGKQSLLL